MVLSKTPTKKVSLDSLSSSLDLYISTENQHCQSIYSRDIAEKSCKNNVNIKRIFKTLAIVLKHPNLSFYDIYHIIELSR